MPGFPNSSIIYSTTFSRASPKATEKLPKHTIYHSPSSTTAYEHCSCVSPAKDYWNNGCPNETWYTDDPYITQQRYECPGDYFPSTQPYEPPELEKSNYHELDATTAPPPSSTLNSPASISTDIQTSRPSYSHFHLNSSTTYNPTILALREEIDTELEALRHRIQQARLEYLDAACVRELQWLSLSSPPPPPSLTPPLQPLSLHPLELHNQSKVQTQTEHHPYTSTPYPNPNSSKSPQHTHHPSPSPPPTNLPHHLAPYAPSWPSAPSPPPPEDHPGVRRCWVGRPLGKVLRTGDRYYARGLCDKHGSSVIFGEAVERAGRSGMGRGLGSGEVWRCE